MLKNILICFSGLLVFNNIQANGYKMKHDTLRYYLKNSDELVSTRDSADYVLAFPSKPGSNGLFTITEYYPNGRIKLTGYCIQSPLTTGILPVFDGECLEFYSNGNPKAIKHYNDGMLTGQVIENYPNGKLYNMINYMDDKFPPEKFDERPVNLVECRDSTGTVLVTGGNGKWITFDDDFKYISDEGPVTNGLREGDWHGHSGDTAKYTCTYNKGVITNGTGFDNHGKTYPFTSLVVKAAYEGNIKAFSNFMMHTLRYPAVAIENNIQGKVIISFDVEKDGTLTNFKPIRYVAPSLYAEVLRLVKLSSPWQPGRLYGMVVQQHYVQPISFTLSNN